jgi:hypothetical protein
MVIAGKALLTGTLARAAALERDRERVLSELERKAFWCR